MTVSRAVQQLVEQGWLERRRGQPTRVAQREQSDITSNEQLLHPQIDAVVEQAKQLGISLDALKTLLGDRWK